MIRIHLLLLWFLLTSCGGLHRINRPPEVTQLKNSSCKTLFKKQRHQYKIAVRETKGRQRWKKKSLLAETKIDPRRNTTTVSNAPRGYIGSSAAPEIPYLFPTLQGEVQNQFAFSSRQHLLSATNENTPAKDLTVIESIQELKTSSDALTNFDASVLSLMIIGFSGVTGVAFLKLFQTRAQRLSRWPKNTR